jgi:TrmH family RNA methyltransferase
MLILAGGLCLVVVVANPRPATNHQPEASTAMPAITSRHHPIVDAFRELMTDPDPQGRRLLLDGAHLIADAHDAGLDFELVVVSAALGADTEEAHLAASLRRAGVEVRSASATVLDAMSPVRTPSGVVAIARRQAVTLSDLVAPDEPMLLVATDVQDPGNVGALVRVAEASGATGMLVCGSSANPFTWKALRGGMASTLRLPVACGLTLSESLAALQAANVRIGAAVPRDGRDPDEVNWRGRVAALIGGEGSGLDPQAIAASQEKTTIPMAPRVESLNVAVAGALLMYAARRQRVASSAH